MSELSISTENSAAAGSHTDNTMTHGVTEKAAKISSFSEKVKNNLRNFFPFTMEAVRGDEMDTQEEELEADYEETSRQRSKVRVSTSTKLPGINELTPPLVTPLVDHGAAMENAVIRIVNSLGEQREQMSIRLIGLERAVHVERESLREKTNRNRQTDRRSEGAKNL